MKNVIEMTKAEKIARILYGAIVRYVKAKKSPASMGKVHFRLDFDRVRRGNVERKIDALEKNDENIRRFERYQENSEITEHDVEGIG